MPYEIVERDGIKTVRYPSIPVPHGHSTRQGGVSTGYFSSLSLSTSTGDDLANVQENRRRLGRAVGLEVIPRIKMVHGVEVATIDRSSDALSDLPSADACVAIEPGVSLTVTTADCVPLIYCCPETGAVGLAHAGWRGTVDGIAKETARAMEARFGCPVDRLRVAIGPCIGRCCFEVSKEVAREFDAVYAEGVVFPRRGEAPDKYEIDLHRANRFWLLQAGVVETNIETCDLCSSCHGDLFFSHRRDRGLTGRMMTVIQGA